MQPVYLVARSALLKSVALLLLCLSPNAAAELQQSLEVVSSTNRANEGSQARIDALSRETRLLLDEYRALNNSIAYEETYQRELAQLDTAQKARIASLQQQVSQARITRQRILPLMRSMADALEQFVVLDLPFHQEQRVTAILQLKQRLNRPDLSVAMRFRLLLEAYQIEQDYSQSVEAWRAPLHNGAESLSVEYLRLGRTALYYQTLDRQKSARWDIESQQWSALPPEHNRTLALAFRVARSQVAPELMELPFAATGVPE